MKDKERSTAILTNTPIKDALKPESVEQPKEDVGRSNTDRIGTPFIKA